MMYLTDIPLSFRSSLDCPVYILSEMTGDQWWYPGPAFMVDTDGETYFIVGPITIDPSLSIEVQGDFNAIRVVLNDESSVSEESVIREYDEPRTETVKYVTKTVTKRVPTSDYTKSWITFGAGFASSALTKMIFRD